jgi:hypothetical protein
VVIVRRELVWKRLKSRVRKESIEAVNAEGAGADEKMRFKFWLVVPCDNGDLRLDRPGCRGRQLAARRLIMGGGSTDPAGDEMNHLPSNLTSKRGRGGKNA